MKILKAALVASVIAGPVFAGGMPDPVMPPEPIEAATTSSSSAGILIPILLLVLLAAAASSN